MGDVVDHLKVPVLAGSVVRLEPLGRHHVPGLVAAATGGRETFTFTEVPQGEPAMTAYVAELERAHAAGDVTPFAQVAASDGRVLGVTRFMTFRRRPGATLPFAVEVGGTWLTGSAQRTGVNRQAKWLLLTEAFERWGVGRVDFKTDARNAQSGAALAALGARLEGVLRCWQPSLVHGEQDRLRDSALFSIVADEWPSVRAALQGGAPRRLGSLPS